MRLPKRPSFSGRRPRVLDLFCCAGGAGMGYYRAGFDVVGVDIRARPNYPFEFHQGDALEFAHAHVQEFDLVHASPPCQHSCTLTKGTNKGREYIDLIPATRELFAWYGVPSVVENVQGSQLRRDLVLCGEMFGLGVLRHRYFEIDYWRGDRRPHQPHRGYVRGLRHGVWRDGPYIAAYGKGGGKGTVREMQQAMDIHWTDVHEELTEAIPPAYTEYIGNEFLTTGEWGAIARGLPDTAPVPEIMRPYLKLNAAGRLVATRPGRRPSAPAPAPLVPPFAVPLLKETL
ncbi:DNA cytosine methyltransferase [Streptomyces tendae]|uniref:DNA methylase n=1 Tax=Streptomyces tendae TaxID=1932 RepID=UPI0036CFACD2